MFEKLKARLIPQAREWWRFASVRIQLVAAALTGWLWFDPTSLLHVWNLMPRPVRDLLPDNFITSVGAVLFILSVSSVLARVTRQTKLEK